MFFLRCNSLREGCSGLVAGLPRLVHPLQLPTNERTGGADLFGKRRFLGLHLRFSQRCLQCVVHLVVLAQRLQNCTELRNPCSSSGHNLLGRRRRSPSLRGGLTKLKLRLRFGLRIGLAAVGFCRRMDVSWPLHRRWTTTPQNCLPHRLLNLVLQNLAH